MSIIYHESDVKIILKDPILRPVISWIKMVMVKEGDELTDELTARRFSKLIRRVLKTWAHKIGIYRPVCLDSFMPYSCP